MNSTPKHRAGKPAEPLTVAAVGVSKLNCEALCGLTERQLYELGRAHKIPRLPGKIPVYRADALLALFTSGEAFDEPSAADRDEHAAVTPAAVLARIGRRVAGTR